MNRTLLVSLVSVVGVAALLVVGIGAWTWATIPPPLDPDSLPSVAADPPDPTHAAAVEEGRWVARSLLADEQLPGLSLAVAVNGEIVWAEGFRWADVEREIQVTPATRFRIGAVSTTLTAAAAGLLYERGLLDLDAPVQRYVPEFPEKRWPVTTRQLMAHAAGLSHRSVAEGTPGADGCPGDAERVAIFADESLRFEPGTEYRHSNHGWVLTGAAVAGAAGEPYLDFLQREVLAPLELAHTGADLVRPMAPHRARLYFPRLALDPRYGVHAAPEADLTCILPAGGFLSTPSDLVRFADALVAGELLRADTVEELWTPFPFESEGARGQALGWVVHELPMGTDRTPRRVVGQGLGDGVERTALGVSAVGGQVPGGTAALLVVPDARVAVAVTSNVSGARNVPLLALRLADAFVRSREGR